MVPWGASEAVERQSELSFPRAPEVTASARG